LRTLLSMCIIALPGVVSAQANGETTGSVRTTRSGVYTADQATKGREIYSLSCVSCHAAVTHTGPAFAAKWHGQRLSELYQYIVEFMPKADPGSLSPEEYTLVLAYLLRMNGMPAGAQALPVDTTALGRIRIDLKATRDTTLR